MYVTKNKSYKMNLSHHSGLVTYYNRTETLKESPHIFEIKKCSFFVGISIPITLLSLPLYGCFFCLINYWSSVVASVVLPQFVQSSLSFFFFFFFENLVVLV